MPAKASSETIGESLPTPRRPPRNLVCRPTPPPSSPSPPHLRERRHLARRLPQSPARPGRLPYPAAALNPTVPHSYPGCYLEPRPGSEASWEAVQASLKATIRLKILVGCGMGGGEGDGNRTHVASLEGWSSTIELHPRPVQYYAAAPACQFANGAVCEMARRLLRRPALDFIERFSGGRAHGLGFVLERRFEAGGCRPGPGPHPSARESGPLANFRGGIT